MKQLENYLPEDTEQLAKLQKVISAKDNDIELEDLININELRNFFELQRKNELIHNPIFRQALRVLARNETGISQDNVKLIFRG